MLQERYINVGPVRTRFFEGGNPSGTTVVLIHEGGFGGDALNTWERVVPLLASDYRLILPEMLGFGGTDKAVFFGESPYEPRLRHLSCLFDLLDLPAAHIVGNSFGGGATLRLSLRSSTAWRMLSATSINGTGGPFRTAEGLKGAFEYEPSMEAARNLDSWILGEGVSDEEHSKARFESSIRPGQWESMAAARVRSPYEVQTDKAVKWDLPEGLARSRTPTLLIAGLQDRLLERGWETEFSKYLPDVTIETIRAGHAPNVTHPEETANMLRRFFVSVESRQQSNRA